MVARLTATCEPQMNDMLSGGPALSGRSALKQTGDTDDPVEISDGEVVTATIMATAMATDPAADGEAGDAKVNMLPAPYPTPRLRWIPGKDRFSSLSRSSTQPLLPTFWCGRPPR